MHPTTLPWHSGILSGITSKPSDDDTAPRVLALHGWLDNCMSFAPIWPWLEAYECLAIDLPGHGFSSHRTDYQAYYYADYVHDVAHVIINLGWQELHLVGHSMGGGIAALIAATFPERIKSITLIDTTGPLTTTPDQMPKLLRTSVEQYQRWQPQHKRSFPSWDLAIKTRVRSSLFPISPQNAEYLVRQSMREITPDEIMIQSDSRLKNRSPMFYSEPACLAFLGAIKCPVQVIYANQGLLPNVTTTEQRLAQITDLSLTKLDGGHYVHMEHPTLVGQAINDFISRHHAQNS